MKDEKFLIYTLENCSYCNRAKRLLQINNFQFEEISFNSLSDDKRSALIEKTKMRTAPQVFYGEKFIGGFSDLEREFNNGVFNKAQK